MMKFAVSVAVWAILGWYAVTLSLPAIDRHIDIDAYQHCMERMMKYSTYSNGYSMLSCDQYR